MLPEKNIDVTLVKEFYSNIYNQCKVRGKVIKFDAQTLNTFLETPVVLQEGERYQENVHLRNILPERNVQLAYSDYDEFLEELERGHWDRKLIRLLEKNIYVALVKEFYSNIYDPEDDSPKQCKVRLKVIKFYAQTLNTFLEMLVVL
ncbi:hypothetical protein HKD37_14G039280 [Glycine soja]